MINNKLIKIFFISVIVLCGIVFLLIWLNNIKNSNSDLNNEFINDKIPLNLSGKIVNYNKNEIVVNVGQKDLVVKITSATKYFKDITSPIGTKSEEISVDDMKVGYFTNILLTIESTYDNLIAEKIILEEVEFKVGKIESINEGEIIIKEEINNNIKKVILSEETTYYKQSNDETKSFKPEVLKFEDFNVNDLVMVFYQIGLNEDELIATSLMYIPILEINKDYE